MELKKKTIIWEDNNEPPKNYIWAKPNGKFYEFGVNGWQESSLLSSKSEESETSAEDTSYLNLLRNSNKVPKYFWLYNTSEEAQTLFGSALIIGGDYQSPNASRLVVDFSKLNNLGLLNKFMSECGIGSIGFGFIWEPEDNFALEAGDIKGVSISKIGKNFEVTFEYYDDNFEFNPQGVYETVIGEETYYEYNPTIQQFS